MNRNRLIVGLVIFAALMLLAIFGSILLFREWNNGQAQIGQREPLPSLGYCSSNQVRPCILSFKLNARGRMVINVLIDRSARRNFYMKIRRDGGESIYKCRKMANSSTSFSCRGETLPIGEPLQFLMLSTKKNIPLAEGSFSIIGLPIATPEIAVTPTFSPDFDRPPR